MKIIASLLLVLLPIFSAHAKNLHSLISKEVARHPLAWSGFDQPLGNVKKLTIYKSCQNKCSTKPDAEKTFYFDPHRRVHKTEYSNSSFFQEYRYTNYSLYPYQQITGPEKQVMNFERDKYGNILSIDGIDHTRFYTVKWDRYEVYGDYRASGQGEHIRHFNNGLLHKRVIIGAKAFLSNALINSEHTFDYKFHNNGKISQKTSNFYVDGEHRSRQIEEFSSNGLVTSSWTSEDINPNNTFSITIYDYTYDKNDNWISKRRCEKRISTKLESCYEIQRSIEYY